MYLNVVFKRRDSIAENSKDHNFIVGIIMWIGTFVWLWGNLTNVSFFPRLALVNLISSVVYVAQIAFGMVFSIAIEDFVLR